MLIDSTNKMMFFRGKLLFVLLLPGWVLAQTYWQKPEFKDSVMSVKVLEYELVYLNDSMYKTKIDDFILPKNYVLYLNQNGFPIRKTELRLKNDSLVEKGVWQYFYENEKIKKEVYIWNNHSETIDEWHYSYPHPDSVLIVKTTKGNGIFGNSNQYYSYVRKGNKEIFKSYNADSSFIQRQLNVFDSHNRIVRIEKYEDRDYLTDIYFYSYKDSVFNQPDRTISSFTKYDEPFPVMVRYLYNEFGDVTDVMNFNSDPASHLVFEYEYDPKGNWIKKIHKNNSNGKVTRIVERSFKYYD